MTGKKKTKTSKATKTFKSLYEVRETYVPGKDLRFLEGQDPALTQDTFMKILEKVSRQVQPKVAQDK